MTALNELLDDCRKRKVDAVLVWRLDRFGRSLKHLILTLDELKVLGVDFISYKENIDLTTSTGLDSFCFTYWRLLLSLRGT